MLWKLDVPEIIIIIILYNTNLTPQSTLKELEQLKMVTALPI